MRCCVQSAAEAKAGPYQQQWIEDLCRDCFMQLPAEKKKLFKKDHYLTITAMAHIIERHYYKINRHPQTGNFYRTMDTGMVIGFGNNGQPCNCITVITDSNGK
jgi:hypothetical protein